MLRNKPKLSYCGLTVILSNPSRFDKLNLLTATGGVFFDNHCLQPDYNRMRCDIRLLEDKTSFLPNTKCILLLGEAAMHHYVPDTRNNSLNEMRGSPLYVGDIPAIASYFPQDCADLKDHESTFNPESKNYSGEERTEIEDDGDVKSFSNTKRGNYAFWLHSDVKKCKRILQTGDKQWPTEAPPIYKIYPAAQEVIDVLSNTKDCWMDFDIETDYEEQNLLCFSFTFDGRVVYSVPVLDNNYRPAYSRLYEIIRALVIAIKNNTLVAHNGAAFDFFVLGYKYHIPVYKVYDTMLAMHRCYPDVEKSLGHCVSLWTYQRFHKDQDSGSYITKDQMLEKLKYCAKDVFTLYLVRNAIQKYEKTVVGLSDSIACAQRSIRPYLVTMLQGIRYSAEEVEKRCKENDELMMQYNRIIECLIGPNGMIDVRKAVKGKAKMFAGSNKQCVEYFHNMLGYPVVARSPKTGDPALGKKAIYKLALREKNPVITFVMLYRKVQKEFGALSFIPWKDDDGKVVNYKQWIEKIV